MFKLFRNLKPMALLLPIVIILVAGQAVAELYLPQKMSEVIDNGIYLDYEPLYKFLDMEKPSSISGVDSERTLKGYDKNKIPVFEMVDGFSTYDLVHALKEVDNTFQYQGTCFSGYPHKRQQAAFRRSPYPISGRPRALPARGRRFREDYTRKSSEIINIINSLIVCERVEEDRQLPDGTWVYNLTLPIDKEQSRITINGLLDRNPDDEEDGDALSDEINRKIITACISRMKHSKYGNLMPIPIDKDGNRLATDAYGQALEPQKLIYTYTDDDGNEGAHGKAIQDRPPRPHARLRSYNVQQCIRLRV